MERIGVRELRQHASRYLARVEAGDRFEVTDRGRPVAELGPVRHSEWDRLVAEGLIVPAADPDALLDFEPVRLPPGGPSASEVLQRMRDEERF